MTEYYAAIKLIHVGAVAGSGGLFLIRGLARLAGAGWPMARPVRILSYTIDTILLTAALILMTIVGQYPFVHAWLTVKVLLLPLYIALGWFAFWKGERSFVRIGCWVAALAVYGFIISIARAHDPLGFFATLSG